MHLEQRCVEWSPASGTTKAFLELNSVDVSTVLGGRGCAARPHHRSYGAACWDKAKDVTYGRHSCCQERQYVHGPPSVGSSGPVVLKLSGLCGLIVRYGTSCV